MTLIVAAGLIILLVAVLIGLAGYRFQKKPVSLDRFRSRFEESLSEKVAPLHATIEELFLTDVGWSGIEIAGRGVRLISADGHTWVFFAAITLHKPLSALLSKGSLVGNSASAPWHFSGAMVDALKPRAPFNSLHGIAASTEDSLRFDIASGLWEEITIDRGTVTLGGLGTPDVRADISFNCSSSASEALRVVTNPPLNLIDLSTINVGDLEGLVEAEIHMEFAFDHLPLITYRTEAKIHNLCLPHGPADLDLTQGRFDVTVANNHTSVDGSALLGGIPTKAGYSKSVDSGHETLRIVTADVGAIATSLAISGRLVGGHLKSTLERHHADEPWSGSVHFHDVRILKAPLLARLLTMASFPGLLATLTDDGLKVDDASSDVTIEPDAIRCNSIRMSVDQLEITGSVILKIDPTIIEGEGLLIPAASLQRLVGAVPVLGSFLEGLGRKDSPIVATRFKLSGPLSYPEITIHPPTGLAPEILKELGLY